MIPAGETLRLAGVALTRNKMRSFLTALGIIIGVGAVIFMQSIGEGAKSRVRAQIEGAGTNIVMLFSGSSQGPGGRGGAGSQPSITWEDLRAIQTELPSVAAVAPQMNAGQPVISETNTWNTQITGTTPDFFTIRNWPVSSGAMFTASDQAGAAKNAVIGQTAAENLFGPGVDPDRPDHPDPRRAVHHHRRAREEGSERDGFGPGRRDLHSAVRLPDAHAARPRQVRARPHLRERRIAGSDSARAPGDRRACCASGIASGPTTRTISPPAAWRR